MLFHPLRPALSRAAVFTLILAAPASHAFDFNDMMNPNRWMNGGNRNRAGDAPAPVYVPPPAGYVPAAPPPYVAPAPAPGYYGGVPAAVPTPAATPQTSAADKAEIEALKRRVEDLERQQAPAPSPSAASPRSPAADWSAPPTFRPIDQN